MRRMWRSEYSIYPLGHDAAGVAYKDNRGNGVSSIVNGYQMKTYGIMMVCRECRGPILFSTNSKKRPDVLFHSGRAPLNISEKILGTKVKCARCGAVSTAEMQWQRIPPNLTTRTDKANDGRRIWTA